MKFTLATQKLTQIKADCIVVPIFSKGTLSASAQSLDVASGKVFSQLIKQGDFQGNAGEALLLPTISGLKAPRVLLVGCGAIAEFNNATLKKICSAAVSTLKTSCKTICIAVDDFHLKSHTADWILEQSILHCNQANYEFMTYKSKKPPLKAVLNEISFYTDAKHADQVIKTTSITIEAINYTKNIANQPCNIATPDYLAKMAKELAKASTKLTVLDMDMKALKHLKMGGILAVGQGSANPPHLVELRYQGGKPSQAPIVLVGKGVTFDTGGISLKAGASMEEMKFDMCGAATVLGAMKAAVELKLPINIIGLIPTVENMPDGNSYRPGDVITSYSGQTIEITNTDAEGRVILCDALSYAKKFKPKVIIDMATLTGACVVALGNVNAGLFTRHNELAHELLAASAQSDDKAWRLPLEDAYYPELDSDIADMKNSGGRWGGAITAACFLDRFVEKTQPWAHLDIAGAAYTFGKGAGATGRPVALLVQYLRNQGAKK
jgi:leucyl aminopeptidase